jgi:hypothetical protein
MTQSWDRSWSWWMAPGLTVLVCHCGAAPTPPPASAPAPAFNAPAEAPRAPDGAPADSVQTAAPGGQPVPPPPPPPPPAVAPTPESSASPGDRRSALMQARAEVERTERELLNGAPNCENACRALSSMQRAVEHLCALADDSDDKRRCEDATHRFSTTRDRVFTTCGSCR